jgi:hypothetical protein
LINHGESPYNVTLWSQGVTQIGWFAEQTFLYPLPTGIFFTFWGALPYRFSYTLWMFLCLAFILSSVLLLLSTWPNGKRMGYLLPVLAGLVVFRPAIVAIRNGQIGPLLLFILSITFLLWGRRKWFWGGLATASLLMKPTIALPLLGLAAIYLLVNRRWTAFVGMGIGGIVFLVVGWAFDTSWVSGFLNIGQRKLDQAFGYSPTVWGAAHQLCGKSLACTVPLGALFALALVGLYVYALLRFRLGVMDMASLAVPLGLLITPFGWAYEQVLLVIPIMWIMGRLSQKSPFLVSALVFLALSLLSLALLFVAAGVGHDAWSLIVPLVCFIACLWLAPWLVPKPA